MVLHMRIQQRDYQELTLTNQKQTSSIAIPLDSDTLVERGLLIEVRLYRKVCRLLEDSA